MKRLPSPQRDKDPSLAKGLIVVSQGALNGGTLKTSTQPMGIRDSFFGPPLGEGLTLSGFDIAGADARLIGVALALIWATLAVWRGTWVGIKP